MEGIAKNDFHGNRFYGFRSRLLSFFGGPGSGFSGFLGFGNRLKNRAIFVMRTDPEKLNWRGESTTDLSPLKT